MGISQKTHESDQLEALLERAHTYFFELSLSTEFHREFFPNYWWQSNLKSLLNHHAESSLFSSKRNHFNEIENFDRWADCSAFNKIDFM